MTSLTRGHFEQSVNNAASRVRGLWLGYIALLSYLFITVGAVTHTDLLLENPVELPILNVKLSLLGFFAIAPAFLLINHFYLLLHLVGLRRRIREYNEMVGREKLDPDTEDLRRRELDSFVVVQAFGGGREERRGWTGWILIPIIWITVIASPVFVLLQMQIVFLPYQSELLSWVHRLAIIVDLGILWLFWPVMQNGSQRLKFVVPFSSPLSSLGAIVFFLVFAFSVVVATFPGEQIDLSGIGGNATTDNPRSETPRDWVLWPLKRVLFEGEVNELTGSRASLFSRTLVIPDGDFVDDAELNEQSKVSIGELPHQRRRMLSLRGRNLRGAVLVRADLRSADLSGADLRNANMEGAKLDGSVLAPIKTGANPDNKSDILQYSRLDGAWLKNVTLRGAMLDDAHLEGVVFDRSFLQGASFKRARLQGASMNFTNLQGASFDFARMHGVQIGRANLQGASLNYAFLYGAIFDSSNLSGASLKSARLQVSSMRRTNLIGASLNRAEMQGSSLYEAKLQLASFNSTKLWRMRASNPTNSTFVSKPDFAPAFASEKEYQKFVSQILSETDKVDLGAWVSFRLISLHPSSDAEDYQDEVSKWEAAASKAITTGSYQARLELVLKEISCNDLGENSPYVAEGISRSSSGYSLIKDLGSQAAGLAAHMVTATNLRCPGAVGISNVARNELRTIIKPDILKKFEQEDPQPLGAAGPAMAR